MNNDNECHEFKFDSPVADLLGVDSKAKEWARWQKDRFYDLDTEILDMQEGWIYERKRRNQKGKKIRKWFEQLRFGYNDERISFWKPKINDLVACEARRWKAIQYRNNQMKKVESAFDLVVENTPFCCIRKTEEWPGFAWVEFPHYNDNGYGTRGVSWNWWEIQKTRNVNVELDRPNCPLKQDVGDAFFNYEDRSSIIRKRVGIIEQVFQMSLEKKYAQQFYEARYSRTLLNLVINGRNYLIGMIEGQRFGVIAYHEDVITQVL